MFGFLSIKDVTKIRKNEFKIGYLCALNDIMDVVNTSQISSDVLVSEAVKLFSEQKLKDSKQGKALGLESKY